MIDRQREGVSAWLDRVRRSRVSERERLGVSQPPMQWFVGGGYEKTGIDMVFFTDSFGMLGDGALGHNLAIYGNLSYFAYRTQGKDGESVDPNETEKYRREIAASEKMILETTGFTAQELFDQRKRLAEEYKGRHEAPFRVKLF